MNLITDPLFYLTAIPAVIFLGLSKGGFSGIGMVSTPLVAIILPPLEDPSGVESSAPKVLAAGERAAVTREGEILLLGAATQSR